MTARTVSNQLALRRKLAKSQSLSYISAMIFRGNGVVFNENVRRETGVDCGYFASEPIVRVLRGISALASCKFT